MINQPKFTSSSSSSSSSTSTPKDDKGDMIHFSFTLTYILLLTTGTITFVEALRTDNPFVRHIMNLETCISIVAGYFYSVFLQEIKSSSSSSFKQNKIDWGDITKTRYMDWCITTPMMLLTLCVVLGMHTKRPVHLPVFVCILFLNYLMLYTGYLGERGALDRTKATVLGFVPFFIMFAIIFFCFVYPKYVKSNYILFSLYFVVWSMYGLVYLLDEITKNIALNMLDITAKCFIGLGLWVYYTQVIV